MLYVSVQKCAKLNLASKMCHVLLTFKLVCFVEFLCERNFEFGLLHRTFRLLIPLYITINVSGFSVFLPF